MSRCAVLRPSDPMKIFERCGADAEPMRPEPAQAPVIDSVSLFKMGFPAEAVGQSLVEARGDPVLAHEILLRKQPSASTATTTTCPADDEGDEEEARQLELALKLSLERPPAKRRASPAAANPLWAPPRYMPTDSRSIEAGPRTLNLLESVQVRDGGYGWQGATAFLDTGNQAMTLVDTRFAERHALYKKDAVPLLSGSSFGMAERWTTIRGVVPGSSTRAPVVTLAIKVRDQEMLIPAAVSECTGHDLLLGADVIGRLFDAGFRLGAGSM